MAHDVAERTIIPRPPKDVKRYPSSCHGLVHADEIVLQEARAMGPLR
jgi:hypothetical protein